METTMILLAIMVSVPVLLFQAVKKRAMQDEGWKVYAVAAALLLAGMIGAKLAGLI